MGFSEIFEKEVKKNDLQKRSMQTGVSQKHVVFEDLLKHFDEPDSNGENTFENEHWIVQEMKKSIM